MTNEQRFSGKVAIVTGSAGGIGEAYARALAAEGASVVVADIASDGARAVAASIREAGGTAQECEVDVSSPESAEAMAAATVESFGGIDLLVNNAAIYGTMRLDGLTTVPWDYYKHFMSVNIDGALVCTRATYQHMVARGGGAIVNQSSTAAYIYGMYYGLAKVGVNGITQQLAAELGPQGVRVNAVAPGPIDTEATRTVTGGVAEDIAAKLPLARMGTPDDLVPMVLFLLSEDASWITGQIFNVDGGQIMKP